MEMNIGMRGGKRFGRWLWIGITCLPTVAIPGLVTLSGMTLSMARADEPLGVAASYGAGVHAYYDGNYQAAYDALTAAIEAGGRTRGQRRPNLRIRCRQAPRRADRLPLRSPGPRDGAGRRRWATPTASISSTRPGSDTFRVQNTR